MTYNKTFKTKHKMRKAILLLLIIFMPFLYFCCDSSFLDDELVKQDGEMVSRAKSLLQSSELAIPNVNKRHGVKTRQVDYSAQVSPVWENAQVIQRDNKQILVVPLEYKEPVRSQIRIEHNGDVTFQFAKAFSKLIVQGVGEKLDAYVVTYLPESNYAVNNTEELESLTIYPTRISFHGATLISTIDGTIEHGFLYRHGRISHKFYYKGTHQHDCGHNHNHGEECSNQHEVSPTKISIVLNSINVLTRGGYEDGSETEDEICENCGKPSIECNCWENDAYRCPNCDELLYDCECVIITPGTTPPAEVRCEICGAIKENCTCCPKCGKEPCECSETFFKCELCNSNPCICDKGNEEEEEKEKDDNEENEKEKSPCNDLNNNKANPLVNMELAPPGTIRGATFGNTRFNGTKFHQGIDLAGEVGTPIYTMFSGTVIKVVTEQPNRIGEDFPNGYNGDKNLAGNRIYISSKVGGER